MEVDGAHSSSSAEEEHNGAEDALQSWLRLTRATSTVLDRRRSAEAYWAKRTRPDGRLLLQCRPTSVETGIVEPSFRTLATTATQPKYSSSSSPLVAGSSLVRLGGTHVLAVVTLQVGYVVAARRGAGGGGGGGMSSASSGGQREETGGPSAMGGDVVITCSHRNLIGSSSSSSADPTLTSYLQRVVEENTDLGQLYLPLLRQQQAQEPQPKGTPPPPPSHQAFRLCVGVEVLADAGNVRDAALLACTAALADTCLPSAEVEVDRNCDNNDSSNSRVRLVVPLHERQNDDNDVGGTTNALRRLSCPRLPVPLTIGVWEGGGGDSKAAGMYQLIVDPTKEEHGALSGSITVVVDAVAAAAALSADEEEDCVLSCEMKGRTDLTTLALAMALARGRAKELLPVLRVQRGLSAADCYV